MLIRLLSFLGVIRGVILVDFQGKEYLSWAKRGGFSTWCHVYPWMKVGHVILHPTGDTTGDSSYIKRWKYL